ncbi:calcium-dependent lipid-binding domain-containing protein [Trifolium pratense]|uniref:Calcium-dependent lipid-binding domain-containing protein n=1 Tax=Trifolium pratense TaxID=57577 RepID=A0A2K3LGN2_TRIPR|nr:calcium-dependent lipid-binding domain-containing protein [Trifolium pratense]
MACYQLLELNVISAQDLASVGRSMRTYAVAWIDPDRKLSTQVDSEGGRDPAWNDKFVFRVDEEFLYDENSTITIDIYAVHWFKDIHVGTAHILSEDIIPPSQPSNNNNYKPSGMHFVGLQVLRPSGRPKGILNVGLAVIDGSMRSMPLYTNNNTPSVEYHHNNDHENEVSHQAMPELRRSKSDTSSMIGSEIVEHEKRLKTRKGRASSQVSPSEVSTNSKKKSSSILSGSIFSGSKVKSKTSSKKGKSGKTKKKYSNEVNATPKVSYDYEVGSSQEPQFQDSPAYSTPKVSYDYEVKSSPKPQFLNTPAYSKAGARATSLHALAINNAVANANMEYSTPYRTNMGHHRPMMTNSELGPSASEVAAAVAMQPVMDEEVNSTMTGWSLDDTIEELAPKIERWRTDLPPVYDSGEMSSMPSMPLSSKKKGKRSHRRTIDDNDDGGKNGKFSCFSVICGVECSIVCGGDKKNRLRRTESMDNESYI